MNLIKDRIVDFIANIFNGNASEYKYKTLSEASLSENLFGRIRFRFVLSNNQIKTIVEFKVPLGNYVVTELDHADTKELARALVDAHKKLEEIKAKSLINPTPTESKKGFKS